MPYGLWENLVSLAEATLNSYHFEQRKMSLSAGKQVKNYRICLL